MRFVTRPVLASLTAAGLAAGASLAACAVAGTPAVGVRVLVRLVEPSADAAAIGALASRHAGVPVTYAAAAGPAVHALALQCGSAAQCDLAVARLRDAGTVYASVEIEGRKKAMR